MTGGQEVVDEDHALSRERSEFQAHFETNPILKALPCRKLALSSFFGRNDLEGREDRDFGFEDQPARDFQRGAAIQAP